MYQKKIFVQFINRQTVMRNYKREFLQWVQWEKFEELHGYCKATKCVLQLCTEWAESSWGRTDQCCFLTNKVLSLRYTGGTQHHHHLFMHFMLSRGQQHLKYGNRVSSVLFEKHPSITISTILPTTVTKDWKCPLQESLTETMEMY